MIGGGGTVKREIEKELGVELNVDGATGMVELKLKEGEEPSKLLRAKDVVIAISNGFSPKRAFKLFDENLSFTILDLKDYVGDYEKSLTRIKGRVIGEEGKTRRFIEEATGTFVSVFSDRVAIIGDYRTLEIAKTAIEMLALGRQHSTVYAYLMREKRKLKEERISFKKEEV